MLHQGSLRWEFTFSLVLSDLTDRRCLLARVTEGEQTSLLHFSQFALIRSNQGDGPLLGYWGKSSFHGPRCCLSRETRMLLKAAGIPADPDAAFLRRVIEADSAGLFRSKFVCFWKRGKEPWEMIFMFDVTFPGVFFQKPWWFLFVWLPGNVPSPPPTAECGFGGWLSDIVEYVGATTSPSPSLKRMSFHLHLLCSPPDITALIRLSPQLICIVCLPEAFARVPSAWHAFPPAFCTDSSCSSHHSQNYCSSRTPFLIMTVNFLSTRWGHHTQDWWSTYYPGCVCDGVSVDESNL